MMRDKDKLWERFELGSALSLYMFVSSHGVAYEYGMVWVYAQMRSMESQDPVHRLRASLLTPRQLTRLS